LVAVGCVGHSCLGHAALGHSYLGFAWRDVWAVGCLKIFACMMSGFWTPADNGISCRSETDISSGCFDGDMMVFVITVAVVVVLVGIVMR
jgi:hypothetical protein